MFLRTLLILSLTLWGLLALTSNLYASDLAKEKRWADQIVDAIMDGEAVWINDGKNDFLGIFMSAENGNGRGVIIMHGTGVHPNWQQVVQPLRVGLSEHGWSTLSIQMPILHNEAEHTDYAPLYDEVAPRINAGIAYLKKQNLDNIILIGHSQGASMSSYYLSHISPSVNGFIAIGMSSYEDTQPMNTEKALEKISIPLLDLYGTDDLKEVKTSIPKRALIAKKAGHPRYSQKQITGNHFYDGQEEQLIKTVADWLNKH